jgi:hypothetical protein
MPGIRLQYDPMLSSNLRKQLLARDLKRLRSPLSSGRLSTSQTRLPKQHQVPLRHLVCHHLLTYQGLRTGQLVKDEYLSLFDAMGALEVCSKISWSPSSLDIDLPLHRSWTRRWIVATLSPESVWTTATIFSARFLQRKS